MRRGRASSAVEAGSTRIGSLFSGIGGLELGLERAGLGRTVWQCEKNPWRRSILRRHWPDTKLYEDVTGLVPEPADLLCGGFPCQDISDAATANRPGMTGHRSSLWNEYLRIIEALEPQWIVVENVDGAARKRWVPVVRRDLDRVGYPSLQLRVRADQLGAPFKGSRIFIVASPHFEGQSASTLHAEVAGVPAPAEAGEHWWQSTPWHLGVDDGIPRGVDRRQALGDAVVPQMGEWVGMVVQRLRACVRGDFRGTLF